MRVLLTNDDGVTAPGLAVLVNVLVGLGVTPRIVAPAFDQSGIGTAVGRLHSRGGIRLEEAEVAGWAATAIDGPPSLAVLLDHLGAFGEPSDLVFAGINEGANCGRMLVHSGTVGAALAAVAHGAAGIALSLAPPSEDGTEFAWDTAGAIAAAVAGVVLAAPPLGHAVNVNVPEEPLARVRGWRQTTVAPGGGSRPVVRVVAGEVAAEPMVTVDYAGWPAPFERETDSGAVYAGYVSVTWLGSVYGGGPPPDSTVAALAAALDLLVPDLPDGQDRRN